MLNNDFIYDVIIVGGGTTGMYASFYTKLRNMTTLLIEASEAFGGKVAQFYPEKKIYEIGGFPAIKGEHLIEELTVQSEEAAPDTVFNEVVTHIYKEQELFRVETNHSNSYTSRTVLLTCGMGTYQMKRLELDEAPQYENTNLYYQLKSLEMFRNKRVHIYSMNRTGIDWAMALAEVAEQVTILNERDYFLYTPPEVIEQLKQTSIRVRYNHRLQQLIGNSKGIHTIVSEAEGIPATEETEAVFYYDNVALNQVPFDSWGLKTDKNKVKVDQAMQTSVPGIFAAGDTVAYPHKNMLIAAGFSEAITAVNSTKLYLDPSASQQVYSTVEYRKRNK